MESRFIKAYCFSVITALLVFGCSNGVEFNNPAFQTDINNRVWRAESFKSSYNEDGKLVITATNTIETVILTLQSDDIGTMGLGPDWNSKGEYIDAFGTVYTTDIEPDENVSIYRDLGTIEITSISESSNSFSGNFYFIGYDENGQNPVGLSNGIFFNVKLD